MIWTIRPSWAHPRSSSENLQWTLKFLQSKTWYWVIQPPQVTVRSLVFHKRILHSILCCWSAVVQLCEFDTGRYLTYILYRISYLIHSLLGSDGKTLVAYRKPTSSRLLQRVCCTDYRRLTADSPSEESLMEHQPGDNQWKKLADKLNYFKH